MFQDITFHLIFGIPVIAYSGMFVLAMFLLADSMPIFFSKKIKNFYFWHRALAITALVLAAIHGLFGVLAFF